MEKDICRRCGCKWNTACVDEMYGSCWWVDKNRTLCSHCFYGFNDESCQTKVYYRPGHDWLERDWEFVLGNTDKFKKVIGYMTWNMMCCVWLV